MSRQLAHEGVVENGCLMLALLLEMLRSHGRQTPEQLAFDHIF